METLVETVAEVPDDAGLLERVRRGEGAAFDEVVGRHRREVYLVARRLLGTHEDADEAAQQTFVRAWKAIGRFRGESSLRTWLIRIAINVAKTMLIARRSVEGLDGREGLADPADNGEERLRRGQLRHRVRRAVDGLPPRQREVVVLKVFSELTHREVAQILGLSQGAVKAHLHQAVSNLRRRMSDVGDERRST